MAAPPLDALAQFLGEAPSAAALRRPDSAASSCARPAVPYRPSKAPSTRGGYDDDSSDDGGDSDGMPCHDGGFDDQADYDNGVRQTAAPRRIREFDEPKDFDCQQGHVPVAAVAAKRVARLSSSKGPERAERGEGPEAVSFRQAQKASRPPKHVMKSGGNMGATATPEPGSFADFLGQDESPLGAQATSGGAERKSRRSVPRAAAEIDLGGHPQRSSSRQREASSGRSGGGYQQPPSPMKKAGSPKSVLDSLPDPLNMSGRRRFGGRA